MAQLPRRACAQQKCHSRFPAGPVHDTAKDHAQCKPSGLARDQHCSDCILLTLRMCMRRRDSSVSSQRRYLQEDVLHSQSLVEKNFSVQVV